MFKAHLDVNAETGRDHSIAFPDLNVKEDVITIVGGVCPDHKYGHCNLHYVYNCAYPSLLLLLCCILQCGSLLCLQI